MFQLQKGDGRCTMISPVPVTVDKVSRALALVGWCAGAFSCNREPAACTLLCVHLIHFSVLTLKGCCVKAVRQNGCESGDVLPRFQLFHSPVVQLVLDAVFDAFDLCRRLCGEGFPFFQGFDLGNDFKA